MQTACGSIGFHRVSVGAAPDAQNSERVCSEIALVTVAPSALSADELGKLKQVTPRIGTEGDTKPQHNDVVGLGNDCHCARLQLLDGTVDTLHTKTNVVPSGQLVAVTKVLGGGPGVRAGYPGRALLHESCKMAALSPSRRQSPRRPRRSEACTPTWPRSSALNSSSVQHCDREGDAVSDLADQVFQAGKGAAADRPVRKQYIILTAQDSSEF